MAAGRHQPHLLQIEILHFFDELDLAVHMLDLFALLFDLLLDEGDAAESTLQFVAHGKDVLLDDLEGAPG
jgi:hypothetical protein